MDQSIVKALWWAAGCSAGLAAVLALPFFFPAPEDRHGGMFALAGAAFLLGISAYLASAALATAKRWRIRWIFLVVPLCTIAFYFVFLVVQVLASA